MPDAGRKQEFLITHHTKYNVASGVECLMTDLLLVRCKVSMHYLDTHAFMRLQLSLPGSNLKR